MCIYTFRWSLESAEASTIFAGRYCMAIGVGYRMAMRIEGGVLWREGSGDGDEVR